MELRYLRDFAALSETLNFTRAAERVHVTQSTLSHQIKQLEAEIGEKLFDRAGRVGATDTFNMEIIPTCPAEFLSPVRSFAAIVRRTVQDRSSASKRRPKRRNA